MNRLRAASPRARAVAAIAVTLLVVGWAAYGLLASEDDATPIHINIATAVVAGVFVALLGFAATTGVAALVGMSRLADRQEAMATRIETVARELRQMRADEHEQNAYVRGYIDAVQGRPPAAGPYEAPRT